MGQKIDSNIDYWMGWRMCELTTILYKAAPADEVLPMNIKNI